MAEGRDRRQRGESERGKEMAEEESNETQGCTKMKSPDLV